jgi:hypothetical protein
MTALSTALRAAGSVLAAALCAVALAGPASAKGQLPENRVVTPGVGVGVVQLGDPMAEASAAWGVAPFCFDTGNGAGEGCVWDSTIKRLAFGPFVSVTAGPSGRITLIAIAKPGWTTKQGIGVGSTRAEVLKAYKGWPRVAPGVKIEEIQLRHGTSANGNPDSVTQFHFGKGRVSMISILAWESK